MVTSSDLDTLRGLADPTRRRIAERLSSGGLPVAEIAAGFPMSRPAVSRHLRVLRELGLVVERREGRQRIYELAAEPLEEIAGWLEGLASAGGARRGVGLTGRSPVVSDERRGAERRLRTSEGEEPSGSPEDGDARWRSW